MSQFFPPTLQEMVAEVEREIALRIRVYPTRVATKRMTQQQADRRVEVMSHVSITLNWLRKNETKIKAALGEKKE